MHLNQQEYRLQFMEKMLQADKLLESRQSNFRYRKLLLASLIILRVYGMWDQENKEKRSLGYLEKSPILMPTGCCWSDVIASQSDVGTAILGAIHGIKKANKELYYSLSGNIKWTDKEKLPEVFLRELIDLISSIHLNKFSLEKKRINMFRVVSFLEFLALAVATPLLGFACYDHYVLDQALGLSWRIGIALSLTALLSFNWRAYRRLKARRLGFRREKERDQVFNDSFKEWFKTNPKETAP